MTHSAAKPPDPTSGALRPAAHARSGLLPPAAAAPPAAAPRRAIRIAIVIATLGALGLVAVMLIQRGSSSAMRADVPGLPESYAVACDSCARRFDLPAVEYRRALLARDDTSSNRIRCPRCGAPGAAYRADHGVPGLPAADPDAARNVRWPGGPPG